MLLIDDRIGSKDLLAPLQQYGVPCELQRLEFGDCAFIGRGTAGRDVYIGIELKETRDLIASLRSNRFTGHQLPGLLRTYDRVWLVTEGIWRAGREGVLEIFAGGWRPVALGKARIMAADLESWILTQTIVGGIARTHCAVRADTVRFLSVLYHWWTHKAFEEHRSHQAIYLPPPDRAMLVEPSVFVKIASCFPGVGWDRAMALEAYCDGSLPRLMATTLAELREIPGIGTKTAAGIYTLLHGADAEGKCKGTPPETRGSLTGTSSAVAQARTTQHSDSQRMRRT